MFLHENLLKCRKEKNLTLRDLEKDLMKECGMDITSETISNWEQGKSEPKASYLQKLAEYYGKPMSYFLK